MATDKLRLKIGDIRELDGFVFSGYRKNYSKPGEFYEHWLSPEAFISRQIHSLELGRKIQSANLADPVKGPAIREKARIAMKLHRTENPEKIVLARTKAKCKKLKILFDLEEQDIQIPTICPALKIPLAVGNGRVTDNSPTLDRLSPKKGYIKGNIVILSHLANRIKNNATSTEILAVGNYLKSLGF